MKIWFLPSLQSDPADMAVNFKMTRYSKSVSFLWTCLLEKIWVCVCVRHVKLPASYIHLYMYEWIYNIYIYIYIHNIFIFILCIYKFIISYIVYIPKLSPLVLSFVNRSLDKPSHRRMILESPSRQRNGIPPSDMFSMKHIEIIDTNT